LLAGSNGRRAHKNTWKEKKKKTGGNHLKKFQTGGKKNCRGGGLAFFGDVGTGDKKKGSEGGPYNKLLVPGFAGTGEMEKTKGELTYLPKEKGRE